MTPVAAVGNPDRRSTRPAVTTAATTSISAAVAAVTPMPRTGFATNPIRILTSPAPAALLRMNTVGAIATGTAGATVDRLHRVVDTRIPWPVLSGRHRHDRNVRPHPSRTAGTAATANTAVTKPQGCTPTVAAQTTVTAADIVGTDTARPASATEPAVAENRDGTGISTGTAGSAAAACHADAPGAAGTTAAAQQPTVAAPTARAPSDPGTTCATVSEPHCRAAIAAVVPIAPVAQQARSPAIAHGRARVRVVRVAVADQDPPVGMLGRAIADEQRQDVHDRMHRRRRCCARKTPRRRPEHRTRRRSDSRCRQHRLHTTARRCTRAQRRPVQTHRVHRRTHRLRRQRASK